VGSCAKLAEGIAADSDDYQVFLPRVAGASPYSFFVAGHTYGVPNVDNPGVHPPFKALFPQINSLQMDFGVFTGDIVIWSTPTNWDEIDEDLIDLEPPVYFAVGNHDMTDRDLFVSRYGSTYYSFEFEQDLFIVLDGELDPCSITGEQMAFLQDVLSANDAQRVFVFVHKLIWVTEDTPYYVLRDKINSFKGYNSHSNFWTDVEPLLRGLDAQVYVVAGDVGVTWAMSTFYENYENIHLIASGMGGSEEENFLVFYVYPDSVQIQVQRLDGQPLNRETIEAYNLAYYRNAQ
jgi:hypothetical protein